MHDGLCRSLVAHPADDICGRADEDDLGALARLGEIGVLGQKAIAGVDGVRACLSRGFENRPNGEVAVLGRGRADPHGFVRHAHMQGIGVGI